MRIPALLATLFICVSAASSQAQEVRTQATHSIAATRLPDGSTSISDSSDRRLRFVPGRVIVSYKSRGKIDEKAGAAIEREQQSVASSLKDLYKFQSVKAEPLHKALTESLKRKNLSETSLKSSESQKRGASVSRDIELTRKIVFDGVADPESLVEEINRDPERLGSFIAHATLDPLMEAFTGPPNDPLYPPSGNNLGQWGFAPTGVLSAWDHTTGSPNTVIAVIDTGVDYTHPDLAQQIWVNHGEIPNNGVDDDQNGFVDDVRGWDFIENAGVSCASGEDCSLPDNDPMDSQGHGTHVAGIAGAQANNSIGIAGVCPSCKIMPLRAGYRTTANQGALPVSAIANAIVYAAFNGADIVNMSFGGPVGGFEDEIIDAAHNFGVSFVAAAGNSASSTPDYPAALDEVIAVASVNSSLQRSYFSNYGLWVAVAAPGESIISTLPSGQYGVLSGTSMASPFVAGILGLLRSQYPAASSEQLRELLQQSAQPSALSGNTSYIGYGLGHAGVATSSPLPPVGVPAAIDALTAGAGTVDVFGSAGGVSYSIDTSSSGFYSNIWSTRAVGSQVQGGLLGSLALQNFVGQQDLPTRLQVTTANGSTLKRYSNFDLSGLVTTTAPLEYQLVNPREPIEVLGSCAYACTVTWGMGSAPTTWSSAGVVNNPSAGVLARIAGNSFLVSNQNVVSIRIADQYGISKTIHTQIDWSLRLGWPKQIDSRVGAYARFVSSDILGDSRKEVITINDSRELRIYSDSGEVLNSTTIPYLNYTTLPVVADTDGDGSREIVIFLSAYAQPSRVVVYNSDLTVRATWIVPGIWIAGGVVAGNVDGPTGSGDELVISGGYDTGSGYGWAVFVYDGSGNLIPGWPRQITSWTRPNASMVFYPGGSLFLPALAQLDSDPQLEVAAVSANFTDPFNEPNNTTSWYISAFQGNGAAIASPRLVTTFSGGFSTQVSVASPIAVDLTGDGLDEIVVGSPNGLFAYSNSLLPLSGWPALSSSGNFISTLNASQFALSGAPKVVTSYIPSMNNNYRTEVILNPNGTVSTSRPQYSSWNITGHVVGEGNPSAGSEIVSVSNPFDSNGGSLRLEVWGRSSPSTPFLERSFTRLSPFGAPAYEDLDGNALPELLMMSSYWNSGAPSLYVFEPISRVACSDWPQYQANSSKSGRFVPVTCTTPTTSVTGIAAEQIGDTDYPISEATVRATADGQTYSANTDADGRFGFSLPVGSYTISAAHPSFRFNSNPDGLSNPILIDQNGLQNLRFGGSNSATYSVSGTVVRTDGMPLANAQISIGSRSVLTASNGTFTAPGIADGVYQIRATLPGYTISPNFRNPITIVRGDRTGLSFRAASVAPPFPKIPTNDQIARYCQQTSYPDAPRGFTFFVCPQNQIPYAVVFATSGNDEIYVEKIRTGLRTSSNILVFAGAGDDFVVGSKRADTIVAGSGRDTVSGGVGDDIILGEDGADTLSGGDGNDLIVGGTGADSIDGGAGSDLLMGGDDHDQIVGGEGSDAIHGELGDDFLDGGPGDDSIFGGPGADYLNAMSGNDFVAGGTDVDILDVLQSTLIVQCDDDQVRYRDPNSGIVLFEGQCLYFYDCNGNGVPDSIDISSGTALDCNLNSVPDSCDLSSGGSRDLDGNSVPDECQLCVPNPSGEILSAPQVLSLNLGGSGSAVWADLNADGRLDFVGSATGAGSTSVVVVLAQSDGSFGPAQSYASGPAPREIVSGDVDGDSDTDIVAFNTYERTARLLRNNGNGTFASPETISLGLPTVSSSGSSLFLLEDLNNDQILDLIVGVRNGTGVRFYRGNGNGSFSAPVIVTLSGGVVAGVTADLNGDGRKDLAVARMDSGQLTILRNDSSPATLSFSDVGLTYSVGLLPLSIAAADFDSDGDIDIAVGLYSNAQPISIRLNSNFTFGTSVNLPQNDRYTEIRAVDLDADSVPEILGIAGTQSNMLKVFARRGGAYVQISSSELLPYSSGLSTGRLAGDSHEDVSVFTPPNLSLYFNRMCL